MDTNFPQAHASNKISKLFGKLFYSKDFKKMHPHTSYPMPKHDRLLINMLKKQNALRLHYSCNRITNSTYSSSINKEIDVSLKEKLSIYFKLSDSGSTYVKLYSEQSVTPQNMHIELVTKKHVQLVNSL